MPRLTTLGLITLIFTSSAMASSDFSLDVDCGGKFFSTITTTDGKTKTTADLMGESGKKVESYVNEANELVISFHKTLKDDVPHDDLEKGLLQCQVPCKGLNDRTRIKIEGELKVPYERGNVTGTLFLKVDARTIGRRMGGIFPFALWPKNARDMEIEQAFNGNERVQCLISVH